MCECKRGLIRDVKGEHVRDNGDVLLANLFFQPSSHLLVRQVLWLIAPRACRRARGLACIGLSQIQAGEKFCILCYVRGMQATYYKRAQNGLNRRILFTPPAAGGLIINPPAGL